ncbi:MAG: ABC transporter permease [Hyphomicrobiales bacterium]
MRNFFWTFVGLLSFWRKNPLSCVTLIVGLGVATALWSGVQALNAEARQSYDQAASTLGADQFQSLIPSFGSSVAQALFVKLRRAGWRVSPVLEGRIRLAGQRFQIIGIDPVTLPDPQTTQNDWLSDFSKSNNDLVAFLTPPYRAFVSPAIFDGGLETDRLPPLAVLEGLPPRTILTDIGIAQGLLNKEGQISRLIIDDFQKLSSEQLKSTIPNELTLKKPEQNSELDKLTSSFHLNLTAFGFLSFVVGLFIVNSAVGLAFEHRKSMVRTFRACGVSAKTLMFALLAELLLFAIIAGGVGVLVGYLIASALLPNVSASLEGLYGASVTGTLTLKWYWWASGLLMAILGALFAAGSNLIKLVRMPILSNAHPFAWREAGRRMRRWQIGIATFLCLVALGAYAFGGSLVAGFMLMGAVLLAAALALPSALASILSLFETRAKKPISQWFWADSVQHMSGLSLALMALLLALAINIGVGTMVQSFRTTFIGWLDQRLASDIYLNTGTEEKSEKVLAYLNSEPGVTAILPIWNIDGDLNDWPIEIYGIKDHAIYRDHWPLLAHSPDAWDAVAGGTHVLVSEQLAHRFDLKPGSSVKLGSELKTLSLSVSGIYSDYGNPIGQILVSVETLIQNWPSARKTRFGLQVEPERKDAIIDTLSDNFDFGEGALIDQDALKSLSKSIFEKTFAVTLALNALTLLVAGIALLTNLLTLSQMRLPQLAPIWAMGLTRKRLSVIELAKAASLALLTTVLALPLGLLVAWILLDVINVEAFGWRIPISLFPWDWVRLLLLALFTAILAAAYPAYKLRNTPPSELLKVFANER